MEVFAKQLLSRYSDVTDSEEVAEAHEMFVKVMSSLGSENDVDS